MHCSIQKQIDVLVMVTVLLKYWCNTLDETVWAYTFRKIYLSDGWDNWFVTASNTPGVVPNSQSIKNHHFFLYNNHI